MPALPVNSHDLATGSFRQIESLSFRRLHTLVSFILRLLFSSVIYAALRLPHEYRRISRIIELNTHSRGHADTPVFQSLLFAFIAFSGQSQLFATLLVSLSRRH